MNLLDMIDSGTFTLEENTLEGYRLHKIQLYNWGTFDKNVWTFDTKGETSLLTGDVGSGKSTIVDAITTLLVPPQKIMYNKAADASAKERNLTSYVRGYHGQQNDELEKGKNLALRDFNKYSVLLATLKDTYIDESLTLAQVFYFTEKGSTPKKIFVVSERELSIEQDFSRFDADFRVLRKRLKEKNCSIYDDFAGYSERYRTKLGLQPQAVELFAKTISMKDVRGLNGFVRNHMIEANNISAEELLHHYSDLNHSYQAILLAKNQIELLQPIKGLAKKYESNREIIASLELERTHLPWWIANQKQTLYTQAIQEALEQQQQVSAQLQTETKIMESIELDLENTNREIAKNDGNLLQNLKNELENLAKQLVQRQIQLEKYTKAANLFSLPIPYSFSDFTQNTKIIQERLKRKTTAHDELIIASESLKSQVANLKEAKNTISEEILSLQSRTSNMERKFVDLRNKMCLDLGIAKEELPFVGELLEVKEGEEAWEGALERLVHGFALSILVSMEQYQVVSSWVNGQHLGMKLVYFAVNTRVRSFQETQVHPLAASHKIAIKEDTSFQKWLHNEIGKRFDFVCTETLEQFQKEKKAMTKNGQIKSQNRHEKDDRTLISDRKKYILGFTNQKKILLLEEEKTQLSLEITKIEARLQQNQQKTEQYKIQLQALHTLANFENFEYLDVATLQQTLEALQKKIKAIEASNNILRQLQNNLTLLKTKKVEQQETLHQLYFIKNKQQDIHAQLDREHHENKNNINPSANTTIFTQIDKICTHLMKGLTCDLQNIQKIETKLFTYIMEQIQKEIAGKTQTEANITRKMLQFKNKFPEAAREVDDTIQSLQEYLDMLAQREHDDLPRFEKEFKRKLQTNVLRDIGIFAAKLDRQNKEIRIKIDEINASLYNIDYNPKRYIKLEMTKTTDPEIKQFASDLKQCTENAAEGFANEEAAENLFVQIKKILDRFQGRQNTAEQDAKWTKKVMDVRNWWVFSASERYRQDDTQYEYYTDSGGKSGGQKEKLAYTILAASLAYNFGLTKTSKKRTSFRFVMIDEAFLKSSDTSAKFGLDLFKELNFQLLIVTPLLKIPTIEPYIANVGLVTSNDETHRSTLTTIPILTYKDNKKEWQTHGRLV